MLLLLLLLLPLLALLPLLPLLLLLIIMIIMLMMIMMIMIILLLLLLQQIIMMIMIIIIMTTITIASLGGPRRAQRCEIDRRSTCVSIWVGHWDIFFLSVAVGANNCSDCPAVWLDLHPKSCKSFLQGTCGPHRYEHMTDSSYSGMCLIQAILV